MAGAAELFTVCGSCGQQVSTFVTECPYCGNRLRKRAPKLDRKDGDLEALFAQLDSSGDDVVPLRSPTPPPAQKKPSRFRRAPKPDAIPKPAKAKTQRQRRKAAAYAGDPRPWATIAIVLISLIGLPVTVAIGQENVWLAGGIDGSPLWLFLTSSFTYVGTWHALGVLTALGVFGWLWERRMGRLGSLLVLGTFLVAGVGGLALASAADASNAQTGAVGAASALATAWIVAELRARRRNESIDGDLLGAAVLLAVALLVSAVTAAGAPIAGAWGVLVGLLLGLGLSAARR
ncbi:MAG: rhomboid family intramembrane serine protease [Patulibacter sp.]|nr:rhomboid family intramembrane serine protease [Patulibacter sp.]